MTVADHPLLGSPEMEGAEKRFCFDCCMAMDKNDMAEWVRKAVRNGSSGMGVCLSCRRGLGLPKDDQHSGPIMQRLASVPVLSTASNQMVFGYPGCPRWDVGGSAVRPTTPPPMSRFRPNANPEPFPREHIQHEQLFCRDCFLHYDPQERARWIAKRRNHDQYPKNCCLACRRLSTKPVEACRAQHAARSCASVSSGSIDHSSAASCF